MFCKLDDRRKHVVYCGVSANRRRVRVWSAKFDQESCAGPNVLRQDDLANLLHRGTEQWSPSALDGDHLHRRRGISRILLANVTTMALWSNQSCMAPAGQHDSQALCRRDTQTCTKLTSFFFRNPLLASHNFWRTYNHWTVFSLHLLPVGKTCSLARALYSTGLCPGIHPIPWPSFLTPLNVTLPYN